MVKLFESFINNKIELDLPQTIKWYTCGPTVYADSHLGHARTFITFDILRRYLESIGHTVLYCMNITDIDDKISNKVKQIHWNNLLKSKNVYSNDLNSEQMEETLLQYYKEEELWPPKELFYEFVNNEEKKFWEDMKSINVKMPFSKIRVTQVHKEMIEFINELIEKEFAYISKGSVYFDTQKFNTLHPGVGLHKENDDDINIKNDFEIEKKHPRDFALWKAAKKYEITFESPYSYGHYGWHTECCVMIKKLFGNEIDIHSGGIDLKHPHHHNEGVQTTALTNIKKWVKYFLHSGHLYINKEKMAKSLGNFVTIKNFLNNHNYRVLRLIFMNSNWNEVLDFNEGIIIEAEDLDKRIQNLNGHLEHHIRLNKMKNQIDNFDIEFDVNLEYYQKNLKEHWENFNTIKVLTEIRKLIDNTYKYLLEDYNLNNLVKLKKILDAQFDIIGIDYNINMNNQSDKFVDSIIDIRNKIKNYSTSLTKEQKEIKKKLFEITDWIRDSRLKDLGVKIEDQTNSTKWNYI